MGHTFTEKELDGETGLTYFGARYLDAEVGSWTAVDPMGQYHNGYSFVGGNLVNYVDLWGLEGEPVDGEWDDSFWDLFQDRGGTWVPTEPKQPSQPSDASNVAILLPPRRFKDPVIREAPDYGNYIPDYTDYLRFEPNFQLSKTAAKNAPEVIITVAMSTPWGVTEGAFFRMGRMGMWLLRAGRLGKGLPGSANFAQKTFREVFSKKGRDVLSKIAGKSIRTVDDLAEAIRSGTVHPGQVPVNYIVRDGQTLILNTRTAVALERAGVPRSAWNAVNQTGDDFFEGLLSDQLRRNELGSGGIRSVIPE